MSLSIFWLFPQTYFYLYDFLLVNFSIFLFNIIPLYPLDSGRIVCVIVKKYNKISKYKKFMKIFTIITIVVFLILFINSIQNKINYSFLFISIFLLLSICDLNKNAYFENSYKYYNKSSKVLPIKNIYVDSNVELITLTKYISNYSYHVFYFFKDGKLIKTLTEDQLIELL